MPRYRYKVVSASGTVTEGEMEAVDRQAVIDGLHQQGGTPIRADPVSDRPGLHLLSGGLVRKHGFGPQAVALMTREMATLLRAGLPVDRALSILMEISKDRNVQLFLEDVLKSIRGGSTLAGALEAHRASLPVFYIGLVRAGEAGGALDAVLWRLADALEHGAALRETIRSAMYYPAFVLFMSLATLAVMFTMVIPEFRPLFEDSGTAMPSSMAAMIAVSDGLREGWWVILLAVVALLVVGRIYSGAPEFKRRRDRWILRLPLIGELVTKIEVARFSRTLGILLAHGVMVLNALSITAEAVANREIGEAIKGLSSKLGSGEGLASPLMETGLFPRLAVQLIRVGEESGQLEPMLLRVAEIYDGEVKHTLQRILSLLVPVMTICIGILVGGIIATMLTAILSTYDISM
jgi:general secretion pathway protein F